MVLLAVGAQELDVLRVGEILAQKVAGAGLQGLLVLHHRLDGVGVDGAGEALMGRFFTLDHRHGHGAFGELAVDLVHLLGFGDGFLGRGVGGVALLPEELGGAQEQAGAHFPAHDVAPLVDQDRQVAVGLDPAGERGADDGLGGRAHDQRLFQLALGVGHQTTLAIVHQTVMGDHRAFLGEAFDVLGLLLKERLGDEQREVGILVAGGLELLIQVALHVLPQGIAPGLDHHAAAHIGIFGQVGGAHDLLVPLGVVLGASRRDGAARRILGLGLGRLRFLGLAHGRGIVK